MSFLLAAEGVLLLHRIIQFALQGAAMAVR